MNGVRTIFAILALIAGSSAIAQGRTDISVGLAAQPSSGLVPGQPIVFTLAVTNNGPESVDDYNLALYSSDILDQFDASSGSTDCQGYTVVVSDGKTFHFNIVWSPTIQGQGALEVGETRSCHISLALSSQAPAVWPFSFGVADFFDDLNPDNNVSTVILRRGDVAPVAVPTLSISMLVFFIVVLATVACAEFARNSNFRVS